MTDECRKACDLLDSYLSGELLVETNHAVLDHVASCRSCARELERRQVLVALLREAHESTPQVGALRKRVGEALDREERHGWPHVSRRWIAAAIVLLAMAVVSWYLARGVAVDAAALRDSVGDHVECALATPAAAAYDPARVARRLPPQFSELAQQFVRSGGNYRLVDAHACPYKDRRYAHFVFRRDGHVVSLFVDDRPRGALPSVAARTEGEFQVAAAATSQHQIFVVCDRGAPGADTLGREMLTPSIEFVRGLERHERSNHF